MNPSRNRRFRLTLQYDGSYLMGWQLQPRGRTVQGELEDALKKLTGERYPVVGSGRTDSGVHATGQVAAVTLPSRWDVPELHRALNALLPSDIWVQAVEVMPEHFHPRFHATARGYTYRIGLKPEAHSPFFRPWCWPLAQDLSLERLAECGALLPGNHSFKAFAKTGQEHRGDICEVQEANWYEWGSIGIEFRIKANRFLHHMVRYLVGTMVDVGLGRRPLGEMETLLSGTANDLVTSPPAPPDGLFLSRVFYPDPIPDPGPDYTPPDSELD